MIKEIKIIEDYELMVEKESHRRFRTKTITPGRFDREKEPYEVFYLFEKDTTIKLQSDVNLIVGENGTGKSTFIQMLKDYIGERPTSEYILSNEEELLNYHKNHIKNREGRSSIKLIEGEPNRNFGNTIYFDGEEDNPIMAIPKINHPGRSDFNDLSARYFFTQEESHGESMIPLLDFITTEVKDCLIIMDEPETALSIQRQIWFARAVQKSASENGNQFIISTHSLPIMTEFHRVYDMEERKWLRRVDYIRRCYEEK